MRKYLFACLLVTLSQLTALSVRATAAAPGDRFIRLGTTSTATQLETAVTHYEKGDITVDLIGAIHIADKKYYTDLNALFECYEVLLFETVGGERIKAPVVGQQAKGNNLDLAFLANLYEGMTQLLELSAQRNFIDYKKPNFVHADLTLPEFRKAQAKRGETLFGFFLQLAFARNEFRSFNDRPNPLNLWLGLLTRNPNRIKLELMKSFVNDLDQMDSLRGENVIISDRNARCIEILAGQLQAGKSHVGIFYGAAHFPDMDKRLLAEGFTKAGQDWLTAWYVPKQP